MFVNKALTVACSKEMLLGCLEKGKSNPCSANEYKEMSDSVQ